MLVLSLSDLWRHALGGESWGVSRAVRWGGVSRGCSVRSLVCGGCGHVRSVCGGCGHVRSVVPVAVVAMCVPFRVRRLWPRLFCFGGCGHVRSLCLWRLWPCSVLCGIVTATCVCGGCDLCSVSWRLWPCLRTPQDRPPTQHLHGTDHVARERRAPAGAQRRRDHAEGARLDRSWRLWPCPMSCGDCGQVSKYSEKRQVPKQGWVGGSKHATATRHRGRGVATQTAHRIREHSVWRRRGDHS